MTNTDRTLPKWLTYSAAFFLCFFLERCILNRFPLWGALPMLAPLTAAAVGFLEGAFPGSVFGLAAGLFSALALGPGHARLIWCNTLIGLFCGATVNKAIGRTFHGYLLCAGGSLAFLEGLELLLRLFFDDQAAGPVLSMAGAEGLYSFLFSPLVYLLFWHIYRRFRSDLEF